MKGVPNENDTDRDESPRDNPNLPDRDSGSECSPPHSGA